MSARMRINRSQTRNRRSHHRVVSPRLSTCADCTAKHLRHHVCEGCGKYRGRLVVDVVAVAEKRAERMKRRDDGQAPESQDEIEGKIDKDTDPPDEKHTGELDVEALSKK